ncbi:MAG: hypothetical protein LBH14_08505, partial [Desulfobulbaceae bacterium]|nr:hypothetical protein [Desulfobulbaceae bacterium]
MDGLENCRFSPICARHYLRINKEGVIKEKKAVKEGKVMERRDIYQSIAAVSVFAAVLAATNARGEGHIIITPHIEVSVEHDSNFFRTEHNAVPVTTRGISPGIQGIYTTAKTKVTVDGTLERRDYSGDNSPYYGSISSYSYTGGQVSLDATSHVTNRLTVGVKDGLRVTRDPQ